MIVRVFLIYLKINDFDEINYFMKYKKYQLKYQALKEKYLENKNDLYYKLADSCTFSRYLCK